MWKARVAVYLTGLLGGLGLILSFMGLATYDPVSQTIDLHPISIPVLVGIIAPTVASALTAVAAVLDWSKK